MTGGTFVSVVSARDTPPAINEPSGVIEKVRASAPCSSFLPVKKFKAPSPSRIATAGSAAAYDPGGCAAATSSSRNITTTVTGIRIPRRVAGADEAVIVSPPGRRTDLERSGSISWHGRLARAANSRQAAHGRGAHAT